MPDDARHIPELDGVRGLAILLVIAAHFGDFKPQTGFEQVFHQLVGLGWSGVDVFFVLSGFLITRILLESKQSSNYYQSFYLRRVLRIFPLYLLFIFSFFCIALPVAKVLNVGAARSVPYSEQIWYWSYLSNWRNAFGHYVYPLEHTWSLAVEEQFYLFWPLVVMALSEARLLRVCCIMMIASFVLRNIFQLQTIDPDFVYRVTPFRLEPLGFGASIAVLARQSALATIVRTRLRFIFTTGILLLAGVLSIKRISGADAPMITLGYTSFALIYSSLVSYCVIYSGTHRRLTSLLRMHWLMNVGKYSYAMYLLHMPIAIYLPQAIRIAVRSPFLGNLAYALISITAGTVISYALAQLSWRFVEKRFIDLKKRFPPDAIVTVR